MLDALELIRADRRLRGLLDEYHKNRARQPHKPWHDRIMALDGVEPRELSRLHGLLLANGWLETRVFAEAFSQPGTIADAYRITRDGLRALAQTDDWLELSDPVDGLLQPHQAALTP
jgi:hypothetical protein